MDRLPIVPECKGCKRIEQRYLVSVCQAYHKPSYWWHFGGCPLHTQHGAGLCLDSADMKQRLGQQKQRKRR